MEWGSIGNWIVKYKYALLVLALGLGLMLLPEKDETQPQNVTQTQESTMQEHLQQILSQIEGAGKVEVLLSEAQGSQTLYQTDIQTDLSGENESTDEKTVIVTDSDHNESGLIARKDPPVYLGAVIVCQGADRAEVKLAIVEAVRCATGLGANQISVVKMK